MNNNFIQYQVNLADPSGHRFHILLTVPQPNPAGQTLSLPAWIPGSYLIRDFARQIETIQAYDDSGLITINKTDSNTWQCAPAQGSLHIEYTVYAWDLSVRGAHFDETHAFFNGTSLFLCVTDQADKPCLLDLKKPVSFGTDWKVYTSLPLHQDTEEYGFGLYQAPNYDALIDYPVEIGTPQVTRFNAYGAEHEFVITGVVPGLDLNRIAFDAHKICATQIELFEPETRQAPFLDSAQKYTFLTMVTGDGYGGLEHRASTALMINRKDLPTIDNKPGDGYANFLGLVSHEYFHTWNVKRIKPAVFAPYDLNQPNFTELLWVFEGFTSYYDDMMLLRSAVIDEKRYFELLARNFDHVLRGQGRFKQSIAASSFDAWTRYYKQDENSPNALVSYYTKGALFAMALDLELRWQTDNAKGLDDVMRFMWDQYGRGFYQGQSQGIAENSMPDIIEQATGVDLSEFIQCYAYGTEDIPFHDIFARVGISLNQTTPDPFPGLDIRFKNDTGGIRILTAYENGVAHKAGLSAGDLIIAIDGLRSSNEDELKNLLAAYQAGQTITIHVFRRDELRQFKLTLKAPKATKHHIERIAQV